jgi:hypothetical protein
MAQALHARGKRASAQCGAARAPPTTPPPPTRPRSPIAKRCQHLLDMEMKLRIEDLERQANYGMSAFLVLGDLLSNVRSNGGMTSDVIDNTFAELVHYFEAQGGAEHPIVKYVRSMWRGDAAI